MDISLLFPDLAWAVRDQDLREQLSMLPCASDFLILISLTWTMKSVYHRRGVIETLIVDSYVGVRERSGV